MKIRVYILRMLFYGIIVGGYLPVNAVQRDRSFLVTQKSALVRPGTTKHFDALKGNCGNKLQLYSVAEPRIGKVRADFETNSFIYKAPSEVSLKSVDSFSYTLINESGDKKTAPILITLGDCTPCKEQFTIITKTGTVCPGDRILFDALEGNSGCDLMLESVTQPRNGGTVIPNFRDNTFVYKAPAIRPKKGKDTFCYTLSATVDPKKNKSTKKTAPVKITVACCDPFVVNPLQGEACPGDSFLFDALADNSGCNLRLIRVSQPLHGTVTLNSNKGTFTYTAPQIRPPSGMDNFTYTLAAEVFVSNELTAVEEVEMTAPVIMSLPCCIPCRAPFEVIAKTGTVCLGDSLFFNALEGNSGCNLALKRVTQPINGGTVIPDFMNNTFVYSAPVVVSAAAAVVASSTRPSNGSNQVVTGRQFQNSEQQALVGQTADQLAEDHFTYTLSSDCSTEITAPVTVTIECCEPFQVNPKCGRTKLKGCVVFDALEGNSGCLLSLNGVTQPRFGRVVPDFTNNVFTYKAPAMRPRAKASLSCSCKTSTPKKVTRPFKDTFTYSLVDVQGQSAAAVVTVVVV